MRTLPAFTVVSAFVALAAPAPAQTLRVDGAALRIERCRIDAAVESGIARVEVEELFRNSTARVQEGVFEFRLPEDAVIGAFSMWMEGREQRGFVLEAAQARATYDSIVRRRKDPALLEQVGWRDFRVSVFPIPAHDTVKVKLVYAHVLRDELGIESLELPLPKECGPVGDLSVAVGFADAGGLAGIDSPSHGDARFEFRDGRAQASWSGDGIAPERDFVLRALRRDAGFSLTLLAHRPVPAGDGWFVARVVPRLERAPSIGRDLVFVVDRSGSMQGQKLEQARAALLAGLASLRPGDRFDVVTFASDVTALSGAGDGRGLLDATRAHVDSGRRVAQRLEATGGTNIDAALKAALAVLPPDPERFGAVILLTDGDPTVGETQPERLLAAWREARGTARLFAFGVGKGVKEFLLSKLAAEGRGAARYVEEGEDLEVPLAALYERIRTPLLLEPSFELESARGDVVALDREPTRLPDLCQGRALVVAGRYFGDGAATLRLRGRAGADAIDVAIPIELPRATPDRPHVAQIWAKARVERLLDDLRIAGQNHELVDEVRALGLAHSLVTPYTSFLVLEPDHPMARERAQRGLQAEATRRDGGNGGGDPSRDVARADDGTVHDRLPADSVPPGGTPAPGTPTTGGGSAGPVTSGAGGFLTGRAKEQDAYVPGHGGTYRGPPDSPPATAMRPTTGGLGGRRGGGEGFERWEFLWEHRKEKFFAELAPERAPLPAALQREAFELAAGTLRSSDAELAGGAAMALARTALAGSAADRSRALSLLVDAIGHPHAQVRESATLAMGVVGHRAAVGPLRDLLLDTKAGRALAASLRGVPTLQRAFAATALGMLHAEQAIDDLIALVRDASLVAQPDVQALALLALGEMRTREEEIAGVLMAAGDERGSSAIVRAQAPIALARLAQQSPRGRQSARAHLDALTARLLDPKCCNELERSIAIALGRIGEIGDAAVLETLRGTIERGHDDQARHFALEALAAIGARDADPESHAAEHAELSAFLLREVRTPKKITHLPHAALAAAVHARHPRLPGELRTRVARALVEAFGDTAHPSYQGAIAVALGLLDHDAAAPLLLKRLHATKDEQLQGYLAVALGLLGAQEHAGDLRARYADAGARPKARLQCARALGLIGDPEAAPLLLRELDGAATLVEATSAVQALGTLRSDELFARLLDVARGAEHPVLTRRLALDALGRLADPSPLPRNETLSIDVNYRAKTPALAELLDRL